ncbi:hypothetical protein SISNIDRAFT_489764 [Sistotremastrum niveocremeum HHB9708]|uniref:DH domain-containing protein n=1 Tax=Sistotremastrum niveocremeum HHB9708 TaxID=1314777 RepID=A0A164PPL0_9AGAM|nr:hypothetical protein SISNIDRAFT_489764 [Sistotremastrum niveocremeum HHB9708]
MFPQDIGIDSEIPRNWSDPQSLSTDYGSFDAAEDAASSHLTMPPSEFEFVPDSQDGYRIMLLSSLNRESWDLSAISEPSASIYSRDSGDPSQFLGRSESLKRLGPVISNMHEHFSTNDDFQRSTTTRRHGRIEDLVKAETAFVEEGGCDNLLETLKLCLRNAVTISLIESIQTNLQERERLREMHREVLASLNKFKNDLVEIPTLVVFLNAFSADCFEVYPEYGAYVPVALRDLADKVAQSPELDRHFQRQVRRGSSLSLIDAQRVDLLRPLQHISKYIKLIDGVKADSEDVLEASDKNTLSVLASKFRQIYAKTWLSCWQGSMLQISEIGFSWNNLLTLLPECNVSVNECERQRAIFGIIENEMAYINDLEVFQSEFLQEMSSLQFRPLDPAQYSDHLNNLIWIYSQLLDSHRKLLTGLHSIQLQEMPVISTLCGEDRTGIDQIDWEALYKLSLAQLDQAEAYFSASIQSSFSLQAFIEVNNLPSNFIGPAHAHVITALPVEA